MNENLTLSTFAEPITGLADTPELSAADLKRRFQAPTEELRQAHNALAEAHAALDEKVEDIIAETYGGTIHENMLDVPLSTKINAKAEQSDMAEVQEEISAMQTSLACKCELYCGAYTGDGAAAQDITLGFRPKAVLVMCGGYQTSATGSLHYGGLSIEGNNASGLELTDTGFTAKYTGDIYLNRSGYAFTYLAWK